MPSQVRDSNESHCEQRETNEFFLGVSLLAAQILAGLGTNGVNLGKRDLSEAELRGFFDDLWNNALRPPLENALSGT